jgi:pimeloyl-ACP methyl ester carboxylesterase
MNHRFVESNGIKMHLAEDGRGPLVVLCHGFPELWYSWRRQLPTLAAAHYHAVAPDLRGYGQTDRPATISAYNILQLTADIVGLVHALGEERAIIVGHDWGATLARHCALLRPDMFYAVGLLSVPFLPRTDVRPTDAMRRVAGEHQFYQLYFQQPGKAERELEADVRKTIRMMMYALSGDPPEEKRWRFKFSRSESLLDTGTLPEILPSWLTEDDLNFYADEFERTGFRGGLNWYRNVDRNWELTPFLSRAKLHQPSMFAAGEFDASVTMYRAAFDAMDVMMTGLRRKVLIPGAGHWIQQERSTQINDLLIEFFAAL